MPPRLRARRLRSPPENAGENKGRRPAGQGRLFTGYSQVTPTEPGRGAGGALVLPPAPTRSRRTVRGKADHAPEHFHIPAHATIYACCSRCGTRTADRLHHADAGAARSRTARPGGRRGVRHAAYSHSSRRRRTPAITSRSSQEKYTLREIIRVCTEYAARSYDEQDEVPNLLDEVEQRSLRHRAGALQGPGRQHEADGRAGDRRDPGTLRPARQHHRTGDRLFEFDKMTDGLHPAGNDRHRRAAFDGQDRAGDEHRRAHGGRADKSRSPSSVWK